MRDPGARPRPRPESASADDAMLDGRRVADHAAGDRDLLLRHGLERGRTRLEDGLLLEPDGVGCPSGAGVDHLMAEPTAHRQRGRDERVHGGRIFVLAHYELLVRVRVLATTA